MVSVITGTAVRHGRNAQLLGAEYAGESDTASTARFWLGELGKRSFRFSGPRSSGLDIWMPRFRIEPTVLVTHPLYLEETPDSE